MKCGIGDYTYKLSEELANNKNEVHIITSSKASNESEILNIHNVIDTWDRSGIKRIIEELEKIKPDIVNIQYPSDEYQNSIWMNILPIKIKRKLKVKVTATIHEYECYTLKRKIRYYLNFKNLDSIIVAEEEFVNMIKKDFKNKNVYYIPISSSIPRSEITDVEKQNLVDKFNLKGNKVISYFGFANKLKGIENLLKVVSKLDKSVKLLFINDLDKSNEYHNSLLRLIEELNIKDRVIITGFIDKEKDVADLLSISDVCVLPFTNGVKTRNSSFLAAYNQKIPIITTSIEKEDKDGIYYVEPNDEERLLEKIKFVLENEIEAKRTPLTWKMVEEKYIEKFQEVM